MATPVTPAAPDSGLTSKEAPVEMLAIVTRIGFFGDTHGGFEHVLRVSRTMAARGIRTLVVLGDFGFIWTRENTGNILNKLSKRLADRGQTLYFIDSGHEDFGRLLAFPIGADGLRWIRSNLAHIPRGYRTRLVSRRSLAALGGANSIDVDHRKESHSWWADEAITDDDLKALGNEPADILIGHDAPMHLPALDRWLAETDRFWPVGCRDYAASGRAVFHRGFMQVRPKLYLGGHYHLHIDETVTYGADETPFVARVVILDKNGSKTTVSQGILDARTLELTFFARDDSTVTELRGTEGGLWRVATRDSIHMFDLDAGTTERLPGPEATTYSVDRPRPLRSIETCRVGEQGFWTIRAHEHLIDYYWHQSSVLQSIELIEQRKVPLAP